jgi:hypothetical protein
LRRRAIDLPDAAPIIIGVEVLWTFVSRAKREAGARRSTSDHVKPALPPQL